MEQTKEKNSTSQQTGLEMLNDFFYNLPERDKFYTDSYGSNIVDLSWIYTESIPRDIIQKTVARLLQEHSEKVKSSSKNSKRFPLTYEEACARKKVIVESIESNNAEYGEHRSNLKSVSPYAISSVSIVATPQRTSFVVLGADGFSKLRITDKDYPTDYSPIPSISFDDFEKEICKTIVQDPNPDYTPFLKGIHSLVDDSFKNFVKYYKFLLDERKENSTYRVAIDAPETNPTGQKRKPNPNPDKKNQYERKSDIIPISDRSGFLDDLKPDFYVDVDLKSPDGTYLPKAYTTYVYSHYLKDAATSETKNGFLFISEPLSGDKYTRISFISQDDLDKGYAGSLGEQCTRYTAKALQQSREDFLSQDGVLIAHTDFESFQEKINFYLNGTRGKSITDPTSYLKRLQKLYNDPSIKLPSKLSIRDIAQLGNGGTGRIDRSAQKSIEKTSEKTEEKSIN